MNRAGRVSAQLIRQALLVACLFSVCAPFAGDLRAQSHRKRPLPEYVQIGQPDQAKGRRILEEFRRRGLYAGDNYFEFELRVMPRRGAERTVPGRMWTGDSPEGPVSRFVLQPGLAGSERRLLLRSAPGAPVWSWAGQSGGPGELPAAERFSGLAGTDVAAFDLQLGYLYWTEFVYEGVSKVRGRPADTFLMYPPEAVSTAWPRLTGVRVHLDSQYGAPVQAEYIGEEGKPFKSVSVIDLKRVDEQWVVKSIDFRDETTRNKTRFSLTGAAVGLDTAPAVFEPGMLGELIRPPAQDRIQRVAP